MDEENEPDPHFHSSFGLPNELGLRTVASIPLSGYAILSSSFPFSSLWKLKESSH